jgi:signal transduction protein with GAF and PtsI domain
VGEITDKNPMIKAPIPFREATRLKALLDYDVLDTGPEDNFDDLVKMASDICGTKIALVSLVDENRQWFKAKHGLQDSETSRDISFCGHAIQGSDVFVVEDAHKDERFFDNPLVTGPQHFRFYAGAPLISSEGEAIGTLCVIDPETRKLSEEQARHLKILSKQVISQLEIRKSIKKLKLNFHELQTLSKTVLEQQERLKALEKHAIVGQLCSGVSHEINNPLAIISGSVLIVKTMLSKGDDPEIIMAQLKRIDQTVGRLTKIGKALRTVSGERTENYSDADSITKKFHELMEDAKKAA